MIPAAIFVSFELRPVPRLTTGPSVLLLVFRSSPLVFPNSRRRLQLVLTG